MQELLPALLRTSTNQTVLKHLRGASAHSDIAQVLYDASSKLAHVKFYCANAPEYGFCVAARDNVIFAYASGMHTIGVHLSPPKFELALNEGATPVPQAGDGWAAFSLFNSEFGETDAAEWIAHAYRCVPK